jgi:lipopolysaccharide export system protein LptC
LPNGGKASAPSAKGVTRWLGAMAAVWDKTSIYLPVVLMGLLALASYWVVSLAPSADLPAPERAVSQAPDSIMRDFAVRQFSPDGTLQSELFGREMRRYPYNDTSVIDEAHGVQIADTGRRTTFQAQRLTTSNDQSIYWFEGNVIIIREAHHTPASQDPRVEYRGEALTLYVDEDRLESDKPVVITRGTDRISGNRLRYNDNTTVLDMQGRVRALLQPRTSP